MPRFPDHRPRRLRATDALRAMVRETTFAPRNLIYPLFVTHASGEPREIRSMPRSNRSVISRMKVRRSSLSLIALAS